MVSKKNTHVDILYLPRTPQTVSVSGAIFPPPRENRNADLAPYIISEGGIAALGTNLGNCSTT
jgi:hypothetical protein